MYKMLAIQTETKKNWKEMMGGPKIPKNWKDPAKIEAKAQEWEAEALTISPAYPLTRKVTGWKLVEDNDDKGLYGNDAMSLIRALGQEKDVALFGLNLRPALKAAAFEVCDGNVCVPSWIWHPNLPLGDRVDIYDLESVITYGCSTTIDISLALAQLGMGPLPLAHDTPDMQIGYVRQLMGILF